MRDGDSALTVTLTTDTRTQEVTAIKAQSQGKRQHNTRIEDEFVAMLNKLVKEQPKDTNPIKALKLPNALNENQATLKLAYVPK